MRCPNEETRTLFLDDELSPAAREEYLRHLEECEGCAEAVSVLSGIESLIRAPEPAVNGRSPVARLRGIADRASPSRLPVLSATALVAATLLAGLWLGSLSPRTRRIPSPPTVPPTPREKVVAALLGPESEAVEFFEDAGAGVQVALQRIALEDDPTAARRALDRLAMLGRRETLPVFLSAVELPDRRREALRGLAEVGDERALPALARLLCAEVDTEEVVRTITAIGGEDAARLLTARITEVSRPEDRRLLVTALAEVDGHEGVGGLLELLAEPEFSDLALAALVEGGHRLAPDLLRHAAGRNPRLARRALDVLGTIRDPASVPGVAGLLEKRELRARAARVLARIDTGEAAEALAARLFEPEVRKAFDVAGPGIEDWLIDRLATAEGARKAIFVELLGRAGGPRAAHALTPLFDDRSVAPQVAEALGRIGGVTSVALLDRLAADPRIRLEAIQALGETGEEAAVPVLLRYGRADSASRRAALDALARIPSPLTVEAVLELAPRRTRDVAVRTLSRMDRDLVVASLEALVAGEHGPAARRALGFLSPRSRKATSRRSPVF